MTQEHFLISTFILAGIALFSAITAFLWHRVAKDLRASLATAEKAYYELRNQWGQREQEFLAERAKLCGDVYKIEDAARRLAPIVRQYAKDLEETAALLKDESPPAAIAECKFALGLYENQVQLRNQQ